jgi:hypothetical protein
MASTFKDVYDEKYLLLTTYTKDGKPKPTTVWGVPAWHFVPQAILRGGIDKVHAAIEVTAPAPA